MLPTTSAELDLEGAEKVLKLIDMLEDLDDVQNVYSNADIPESVAEQLGWRLPALAVLIGFGAWLSLTRHPAGPYLIGGAALFAISARKPTVLAFARLFAIDAWRAIAPRIAVSAVLTSRSMGYPFYPKP
mgnify:CR=1 FL=1